MMLRSYWTIIKERLSAVESEKPKFISLVRQDGTIVRANLHMQRSFTSPDGKNRAGNFFDLLHPVSKECFREKMLASLNEGPVSTVEAYLKNGLYHPMKWHVSPVAESDEGQLFLCQGYKLLDEHRTQKLYKLGEYNYQLIFESLDTGILFQDNQGEIIAANQKVAETLGVSLERLYQLKNIEQLWDSSWQIFREDGTAIQFQQSPFMRALHTKRKHSEVMLTGNRNQEQHWLHLSAQPIFKDPNGQPFAVVTTITDLTMEKQLILELRERKAVLKSFMKQTPNLAWVVDEDARLLFASHQFYSFFNINEAEAQQKSIIELVPPSVADALMEKHLRVLETGTPAEAIETIRWADGSDYIFHIDIFQVEGIAGKKILGGHAINLTDKYEAEKKLRETNDRLLLLSRAASNAIWEWDMQTGQIFRNEALLEMIGYHTDKPMGMSWWLRRIHPDDRNRVSDAVKVSTEEGKQSWEGEYRFKCADGEYKHMRDKGFIVYENGLPVKMIGSLQDVSTIKQLEGLLIEERLKRHRDVSELVIQAQEKERTQIGHELHDNVNQILSSAKLFFEMLKPGEPEQEIYRTKGIEYISLAVEEIRKLSRELVAPSLKEKNLVDCINQLLDDTRLASKLDIRFSYDENVSLISDGKKVTLFRILQEQLKNILRHSSANRVDICIESNNNQFLMVVKDDGIGFDPDQTFRGIGLSNIYERVRFYDGNAEIETGIGKGCTLKVRLPL